MTYLLAKYTLLFLLAAALGFILGYWFSRRNIEDVSESFEELRRASQRSDDENWNRLWGQLNAIPAPAETDLSDVYKRFDDVSTAVSLIPKPEPIDLKPLVDRINNLENDIKAIPTPPEPQPVDLSPVTGKIDALQSALRGIPKPEPVDLSSVSGKLEALQSEVRSLPKPKPVDLALVTGKIEALQSELRSIPKPEPQRVVDLKPVQNELSTLRNEIRGIPKVETHAPVDLAPVNSHIKSLEQRVRSMPTPKVVDLKPVDKRLKSIESELGKLGKRLTKPARTERAPRRVSRNAPRSTAHRAPRKVSRQEPRILKAALYGKKDDLKMISGVGPKLENLLNKNGVYYFWQVSEWNKTDIKVIDERLDSFKGRISRDNWVKQANRLRRDPTAASMPTDI
jgi:predicted flap endonuclease-1-like 5' DNA nuclease